MAGPQTIIRGPQAFFTRPQDQQTRLPETTVIPDPFGRPQSTIVRRPATRTSPKPSVQPQIAPQEQIPRTVPTPTPSQPIRDTTTAPTQRAEQQFRADSIARVQEQRRITQLGITPPSQRDIETLRESQKRRIKASEFDKLSRISGRVLADVNIRTGSRQGTVTRQDEDLLGLSRKTDEQIGREIGISAGKSAAKGAAFAGLFVATKGLGLGTLGLIGAGTAGAIGLSIEQEQIQQARREGRVLEARSRTLNIFAGLAGAKAGAAAAPGLKLKGLELKTKVSKIVSQQLEKDAGTILDIIPTKQAKIGFRPAKQRAGRITRGELKKGREFRDFKRQQDLFKGTFRERAPDISRINVQQNIGLLGKKPAVQTEVSIRYKGTRGRLQTKFTKDLISLEGAKNNIIKQDTNIRIGQAGQSVRPARLFGPQDTNFAVIQQTKQTTKFIPTKRITQTPEKSINNFPSSQLKTLDTAPKKSFIEGAKIQETPQKAQTPELRGFRPGQRQILIDRLRAKKAEQDFLKISDFKIETPKKIEKVLKKPTTIIKKEAKRETLPLIFPQTQAETRASLGTIQDVSISPSTTQRRGVEALQIFDFPRPQKQERPPILDVTPVQDLDVTPIRTPRRSIRQGLNQLPQREPRLDLKVDNIFKPAPSPRSFKVTPPQPPKIGLPPLPRLGLPTISRRERPLPLFSVGIRRRGREITVGAGLTKRQAKLRLRGELDTTLARSGRVKGLGFVELGPQFRRPKKGSVLPFGSVVEKRKFSLSSAGERREIRLSRFKLI